MLVGNGELEYIHLRSCYVERIVHGLHFSIACTHLVRHQIHFATSRTLCASKHLLLRSPASPYHNVVAVRATRPRCTCLDCIWMLLDYLSKKTLDAHGAIFLCVHVVPLLEHS